MIRSAKRSFYLFATTVLLVFVTLSEADPGAIALNPTLQNQGGVKVYQNAYVKIHNTFDSALYDLVVMEFPSRKRVLSIADFQSGQSFEMSFSKAGEYKICYSSASRPQTCLFLDVLKAKMV